MTNPSENIISLKPDQPSKKSTPYKPDFGVLGLSSSINQEKNPKKSLRITQCLKNNHESTDVLVHKEGNLINQRICQIPERIDSKIIHMDYPQTIISYTKIINNQFPHDVKNGSWRIPSPTKISLIKQAGKINRGTSHEF